MGVYEQDKKMRDMGISCDTCVDGELSAQYYTPGEFDWKDGEKPPEAAPPACDKCDWPYRQWRPLDHLIRKCPKCGEPFCLKCDVPKEVIDAILMPPVMCPICLKKQT